MKEIKNNLPKKQTDLVQTAEELFKQFGFKKITVEDICQKAGTSKMTFYKYFKNKNEIIKFLVDSWLELGLRTMKEIEEMEIPFQEKLKKMLQMKAESTARISKEFAQEYFFANPELKEYMDSARNEGLEAFMSFIKNAQKKGEVRKSMKPEFFLAVLNKLQEMVSDDKLISLYPNYQDFVLEFNNFVFYGLLPED